MTFPNALRCISAIVLAFAVVGGSAARAGDDCPPPPPCGHYEYVSTTRCVEVPFVRVVTLYDHCGRPYRVERSGTRTVEVASRRRVFVLD